MERQGQSMSDRKSWFMFGLVCIGVSILVFAWIRSSSAADIPGWTKLNDGMEQTLTSNTLQETKSKDVSSTQSATIQTDTSPEVKPKKTDIVEAPSQAIIPIPSSQVNNDMRQGETKIEPVHQLIPLNAATKEQLMELPGIGDSKAKAIIAYREAHGKFASIDELRNVKGIGPKVFAKLKPLVGL
ncbi:hypothetical protein BVG16_10840 [Paenibacillus selenitireducens]|uniref:Helix-hairpin-helix DNA-binding motif class 1 domain-containing protein n=1 Tax=Paenibacillus selenitireducens TaxID=1324314 RepID=A0A1T2XER1_9BACL|nr:helix-hairpin-helix domain-containing protein [Paenibacillus selenitireducens]OPA78371.1 hypothetical protein BVG16_10840 [Paenibacillus selenitireducens]